LKEESFDLQTNDLHANDLQPDRASDKVVTQCDTHTED
jgi:hypothetical protein